MNIKITLSSQDLYDWVIKTAKEGNKTLDQFVEDAIWFYKNDIETPNKDQKDKNKWRI